MIIWQGYGLLAILYAAVGLFLGGSLTTTDGPVWPLGIGLFLGAAATYFTAKKLASKSKTLIDPENGQEVLLKKTHSLFFIPMMYWTYIIAGLGVVFLFVPSSGQA